MRKISAPSVLIRTLYKKRLALFILAILIALIFVLNSQEPAQSPTEISRNGETVHIGKDKTGKDVYKQTLTLKPIHYKDSSGKWQKYDTTLVKTNKNNAAYALKSSDHQAYFTKNLQDSNTLTVEKDSHLLAMNPGTLQYVNDAGQKQFIAQPKLNAKSKVKKNTITYKDIYGRGIDLKFTSTSTEVMKELIIENLNSLPRPSIENARLEFTMSVVPPKDMTLFVTDPANPNGEKVALQTLCSDTPCQTEIVADAEFRDTNTKKVDRNYDKKVDTSDTMVYAFTPAVARDSDPSSPAISSTLDQTDIGSRLGFSLITEKDKMLAKISTPYKWLKDAQFPVKIDPTVSFTSQSADGRIQSADNNYATALAGTGSLSANTTGSTHDVGQTMTFSYFVYQSFLAFDTSSITTNATINNATLKVYGSTAPTTNFTAYAALYDWGTTVTTADWRNTAGLQALSEVASLDTTGFSTSGYNSFTNIGTSLVDGISKTGTTRFILWSNRVESGTTPSFGSPEVASFDSEEGTNDPVLEVTYTREPEQMQFWLQGEDADVNPTYNSMTVSRLWDNSNKLNSSDTAIAFSAPPCEGTGVDGHNRVAIDTDTTTTTGEKCAATFFSPPMGKTVSLLTAHTDSLKIQDLTTSLSSSDTNAAAVPIVRFYKFDGSTYTIFGTLTGSSMTIAGEDQTLTGTPSTNITLGPSDRIAVLITVNITTRDTTTGTDRAIIDFGQRTEDPTNVIIKYHSLSTAYKPELSGPKDDDFTTTIIQQDCNAGLTYNIKWTCIEGADDGNIQAGADTGVGTTGWLVLTDTENGTYNSDFANGATHMYQTVDTNSDGNGSITTVMNSGTAEDIGASPFFNGGLLLWTSNSDYLILQVHDNGTNKVVAINTNGTISDSTTVSLYNLVYLRWTKKGSSYQASYSTDGLTFVNIGSTISHATTFTRTGLVAHTGQASENYSAAFDWFDYTLGGEIADSYLLGHWKFDEGNGTTANNSGSARNAINGTMSNTSWSTNGKLKNSLDFNGTTSYVSVSNHNVIDLDTNLASAHSFSAWIYADNAGEGNGGRVYSKGTNTWLRVDTLSGSNLDLEASLDLTTSDATVNIASALTTGTWNHVVVTYEDDGDDEIDVYVNGILKGSSSNGSGTPAITDTSALIIGNDTTSATQTFDGRIDELKVFNTALNANQVRVEYNASNSRKLGALGTDASGNPSDSTDRSYCPPGDTTASCGPVAYLPFEEKTGTTTADKTGNSNTGTLTNGPTWVNGKIGGALSFDAVDDVVDAGSAAIIDDLSQMSVSAWIQVRGNGETTQRIFNKGNNSSQGWEIALKTSRELNFKVFHDGGTNLDCDALTLIPISASSPWTHIVVTWNGASSCTSGVSIYINGVKSSLDVNATGTGNIPSNAANNLRIGNSNGTGNTFEGSIDEVKIYNYVRSASQVAWDYNFGKPTAHYKLDDCTGTTFNDSSGNGYSGTITIGASGSQTSAGTCGTSGAWFNGVSGKRNYSLNFDGNDDLANTTASITPSKSGSFAIWIKPDVAMVPPSGYPLIMGFSSNAPGLFVQHGTSNPYIQLYIGGSPASSVSSAALTSGVWQHLVGTWEESGSNTLLKMYINGRLVISETKTGTPDQNAGTLGISNLSTRYKGQADDARYYSYPLTIQQVRTIMNDGAVRWGPNTGAP